MFLPYFYRSEKRFERSGFGRGFQEEGTTTPRKEFSRSMSTENWRESKKDPDDNDEGSWRRAGPKEKRKLISLITIIILIAFVFCCPFFVFTIYPFFCIGHVLLQFWLSSDLGNRVNWRDNRGFDKDYGSRYDERGSSDRVFNRNRYKSTGSYEDEEGSLLFCIRKLKLMFKVFLSFLLLLDVLVSPFISVYKYFKNYLWLPLQFLDQPTYQ